MKEGKLPKACAVCNVRLNQVEMPEEMKTPVIEPQKQTAAPAQYGREYLQDKLKGFALLAEQGEVYYGDYLAKPLEIASKAAALGTARPRENTEQSTARVAIAPTENPHSAPEVPILIRHGNAGVLH